MADCAVRRRDLTSPDTEPARTERPGTGHQRLHLPRHPRPLPGHREGLHHRRRRGRGPPAPTAQGV